MEDDILVELSKEDVLQLKETYRKTPESFYVYTLMDVAIRSWENKSLVVTSPGKAWQVDGSIVVFLKRVTNAIFPFSFDKTYGKIREALLKTKRIDACSETAFHNILGNHVDVILDIIRDMNRTVFRKDENSFYAMTLEQAKALDTVCPTECYVKKLDRNHAFQMNRVWPHRFEKSEECLVELIEINGGFGLFLKEDDSLVSWILQGPLGHMNVLQTEEGHKGRGYGKLMLKTMAKYLAEKGIVPVATVLTHNTVSNRLFKGLGFKVVEKSYFIFTDVKKTA